MTLLGKSISMQVLSSLVHIKTTLEIWFFSSLGWKVGYTFYIAQWQIYICIECAPTVTLSVISDFSQGKRKAA